MRDEVKGDQCVILSEVTFVLEFHSGKILVHGWGRSVSTRKLVGTPNWSVWTSVNLLVSQLECVEPPG